MENDLTIEETNNITENIDQKINEPGKFKVIVLNDDYTPMDFVIAMLMRIFRHSESSASELTMTIHNTGSAIAGIYSYEIAEQKLMDAVELARFNGWPLILKLEPEHTK